jgi:TPR repeat protein
LDDGDTDNAVECLQLAAEKGCVDAMIQLAEMYDIGDDVEADFDESIKWYMLAAANGDFTALEYLAENVELDYAEEPLEWCIKVAEYGDTGARLYLAEIYRDGKGVEKNFEESLKWYKLAAEQGNRGAIYTLGYMYYYGNEVERDYKEAYYWFDKDGFRQLPFYICADMYFYVNQDYGNAFRLYKASLEEDRYENAAYKIGEMYYRGLGVAQSYERALDYLKFFSDESVLEEDFVEFAAKEAPADVNYILSEMYKNGWGVDKNLDLAEKLYNAAEQSEWRWT